MSTDFRTRLEAGLLLGDGAMGTEIYHRGFAFDQSLEVLNLTHPDIVKAIHRLYLDAGADLIETNIFGANRFRQEEFGLADQVAAISATSSSSWATPPASATSPMPSTTTTSPPPAWSN